MMRMKPQDHPSQQAEPTESSKYRRIHVTHFGKPVAYGFVILFQESWMINTCPGSQEVQQHWQTDAFFQHKQP